MAPKMKNTKKYEADLTDEDFALKLQLESYVESVQASDAELQKAAIESLRREILSVTTNMTVPKPLKFLRPHYGTLQSHFEGMKDPELKKLLADILSVLAMIMSPEGERASLNYRLQGSDCDICSWGHEYVRNLARELSLEYAIRQCENTNLFPLVKIAPFYLKGEDANESFESEDVKTYNEALVNFHIQRNHSKKTWDNVEPEAVDLSMELKCPGMIEPNVEIANYQRTCHHLTSLTKNFGGKIFEDYAVIQSKDANESFQSEDANESFQREDANESFESEDAKSFESEDDNCDDLIELVEQIVPFYMKHNAEHEAVDLAMEFDLLNLVVRNVNKANYKRTCLYLTSFANYCSDQEDVKYVLFIANSIYMEFLDYPRALRTALCMDNMERVTEVFVKCRDHQNKQQLCFILARHGIRFVLDEKTCEDEEREVLQEIINNTKLKEAYLTLARDLEVMELKSPADVIKAHLLHQRGSGGETNESLGEFIGTLFLSAFVNAGFSQGEFPEEASICNSSRSWQYEEDEHGRTSAAASLGMILLWDIDSGIAQLDKYIHDTNTDVIAGALLGVGISTCNVKHKRDPAKTLLTDFMDNENSSIRIGAIMGLGLAYAGSQDEEICSRLMAILGDWKSPLDVIAFTTISLGLLYVGSCSKRVANAIIGALKDRNASELRNPLIHFLPLGLGLLYLGKQEGAVAELRLPKTFERNIRKYHKMTLLSCAYAGTGNVLKVQYFLAQCLKHHKQGETYQGPAVLGIAMVAMAEEVGLDMAIRSLEHLLQFGQLNIRRAVPLALGLLCISNPKVNVMDTLSRLSHDADTEVAFAAVISLGLIGAGTNNGRIAGMLRNLSSYYYKNGCILLAVRIAQGLVYMGKGLLTLSPYHSERFLLSPTALAGVVTVLHACLDMKIGVLGKYHFVLYFLALAMQPRMLMTLDENLKPLSVPVRVGQALDVAGQVGQPRTIAGFQTHHSTPVLLSAGERAELATEKYIPLSPFLEGLVILKENPEYKENHWCGY